MVRTQIQLPDDLYMRAKKFAAERELSLAELTRRGLELFLARFAEDSSPAARWSLPGFVADIPRHAKAAAFIDSLQHSDDVAITVNVKDFQGFGFARVWNPLA